MCMCIFHKTEVQTVILRCLAGLDSDWFKNYDTKHKYFHFRFFAMQMCVFEQNRKKTEMEIFAFYVITSETN